MVPSTLNVPESAREMLREREGWGAVTRRNDADNNNAAAASAAAAAVDNFAAYQVFLSVVNNEDSSFLWGGGRLLGTQVILGQHFVAYFQAPLKMSIRLQTRIMNWQGKSLQC